MRNVDVIRIKYLGSTKIIKYKTTNLGPIYTHDQDFAIMTSAFAWCSAEPRKTWVFVLVIIFFIIYFLIFFVIIYKASNLSITLPVYLSLSESVNLSINSPLPQTRGPGLVLSLLSRPQKLWFFLPRVQLDRVRSQVRDHERRRTRLEVHQRERGPALAEAHSSLPPAVLPRERISRQGVDEGRHLRIFPRNIFELAIM